MCVDVRKVDTDVVILAIAYYNNIKPNGLWMAFDTGSHFRHIPVLELTSSLDSMICSPYMYFMHSDGATLFRHPGRGEGGGRKQLGSHVSRTQKLRPHLKTSCSCKMGSVTKPC